MDVVSLGFRTDLALLRLGGSEVTDRGDHLVVRTPDNPTFWWGNFLLLPAVPAEDEVDGWLARFAAEFPGTAHRALGIDGTGGTVGQLAAFAARGYDTDASTVMTAHEVREPPRPNREAVCRRLESDQDWADSVELRMRLDAEEYEPVAHRVFVTAKAASNRRLVADGHGAWFGAFLDDRLVAQLGVVRAEGGLARYQTVETDPEFRQRGLAGTLVHAAARHALDELGARTLVMVADPDYVAIRIYRSVGFDATETQLQVAMRPELVRR